MNGTPQSNSVLYFENNKYFQRDITFMQVIRRFVVRKQHNPSTKIELILLRLV